MIKNTEISDDTVAATNTVAVQEETVSLFAEEPLKEKMERDTDEETREVFLVTGMPKEITPSENFHSMVPPEENAILETTLIQEDLLQDETLPNDSIQNESIRSVPILDDNLLNERE